jgi:hypothetical protein
MTSIWYFFCKSLSAENPPVVKLKIVKDMVTITGLEKEKLLMVRNLMFLISEDLVGWFKINLI